jgi:ureidoacrylate peracid hydrolase
MKGATIPADVIERVVARRGSAHPFADLVPRRTALVVIDLQNAFMDEEVGHIVIPAAREIVPNVNRLAAAVRASGGGVFWVRQVLDDDMWAEWTVMSELSTPAMQKKRVTALAKNSPGVELWPGLDIKSGDEIISKTRFSAFLPGSSDLPDRLRARGLDTVIIAGTVTNVCCDSSARDAMMTNFRVIMVSDANAAATQAEHDAALVAFYNTFGDVLDTDALIAIMQESALPEPAGR